MGGEALTTTHMRCNAAECWLGQCLLVRVPNCNSWSLHDMLARSAFEQLHLTLYQLECMPPDITELSTTM
jgi:hypothetical protein